MTFGGEQYSGLLHFPPLLQPQYIKSIVRRMYQIQLQCIANLHTSNRCQKTQFNHGFRCLTRHHRPQDEKSFVHMADVSFNHACTQDGLLKRPHPTKIGRDMRWDSGWFWGGFGVGVHWTRNQQGRSQVKKHTPIMAAAIARWPPWCPPPGTATYNNQPTCCATCLCC